MGNLLLAWAAKEDLAALEDPDPAELGPTLRASKDLAMEQVVLLTNATSKADLERLDLYATWLAAESGAKVEIAPVTLADPSDHVGILDTATDCVEALQRKDPTADLHFLLSAGTPAMHAVWLLLAKSRFHARLVKCSIESGTTVVDLPFEISTDFATGLLERSDQRLVRLTQGLTPNQPAFAQIIGSSRPMNEAIALATRLAPRNVPVLILGESGTGKELFARAIHAASRRAEGPFLALNCGAIPSELIDARLFGHAKGAFTGATSERPGVFEEANGGTLLLDEIGELPLEAQVRLLRTLQEGEVTRVGEHAPREVDVRVVAATHVDLFEAVDNGGFRRDLLYRLAVGILRLPALRERGKDLHELIDALFTEVQTELNLEPDFEPRTLAKNARARLVGHPWPGNVRELRTTLVRAAIYASGEKITLRDVEDSLLPLPSSSTSGILDRPFNDAFDVKELQTELRSHYVKRALAETNGNKSQAAKLMNVKPQTFQDW
ncbi:Nitrogen regulation protein NR(I) [Planctomycetes bacterium Poly30]|uniref:Nitrogen regulation protein NR(I) n=1 Tax=Saltatorellus ferox TaxID=2528018 RepID=A0A518ETB4_9BACT|nr:Nitrogen regulation protein NR(I) [Planctomycetes bacterium Poly30]